MSYPVPTSIDLNSIIIHDIAHAREMILREGAAVYRLNISTAERNAAVEKTSFYANTNNMFVEKISEPSLAQKLEPKKVPKQRVPMAAQGFINEYFTPIHSLINGNREVGKILDTIYQRKTKRHINRLRLCQKSKLDARSLHIEGEHIFITSQDGVTQFNPDPEIGCIAAITGVRSFVYWQIPTDEALQMYLYWKEKGSKSFTKIDPDWMNEHYGAYRRIVTVDCKDHIHLIFFNHVLPHEIALSPSLSVFISPVIEYNKTKIKKICTFHPPEYLGLTKHESNLLGACYHRPGFEWPSGKTAHLIHHRAYPFYIERLKDRFLTTKTNGKKGIQMQLPSHGTICQKTKDYREKLKARGIILPNIAFAENTPHFVVDLLERSDYELTLYGFIPS